jgi:D-lactate dehydrogenase
MKIAFFDVDHWSKPMIHKAFPTAEIITDNLTLDNVHLYKDIEILSTFHTSDVSCDVLEKMPHLKMIATRSTGFNHVDVPMCAKNGIVLSNVPTYGRRTVAEHTFGLILTLTRKLYDAIHRTKHDGLFNVIGLEGTDLFGKTIGIVGLGEIGTSVMKIAQGFGMDVLVYTRTQDPSLAQENSFEYAQDLDDLLKRSDVITLHLPFTPQTEHIINMKNIEHVKRGAYLINTARGGLVETEAILHGLKEEILAGAGLDVLENEVELQEEADLLSTHIRKKIGYETLVMDHVLLSHPRVVVTPHNAFNSREARVRIMQTTFDNIHAFLGGKPMNVVSNS